MKCSELMSNHVWTVKTTDDAFYAARLMREHSIGFLPVCDASGRVLGVVTDRDLAMEVCAADHQPVFTEVSSVMKRPVITCRAGDPVSHAEREMALHHFRRIVIVDGKGHAVGVLSETDIRRAADRAEQSLP